jgi:hypothetical protein
VRAWLIERSAQPQAEAAALVTARAKKASDKAAENRATRDAAAMGGDGADYAALQAALAVRQSLSIETKVTFLQGVVGPLPPVFMPGTGETFVESP